MATKKSKAAEPPPLAASAAGTEPASSFRPCPDLPQDILLSIRDRFTLSIPDLAAFSAVCRSWRSAADAAADGASPFTGPPLLLVPSATPTRSGSFRWSGPRKCRLKALTATTRSYGSAISPETLKEECVGYSNGQLIFVRGKRCVLADVFTGREVRPPEIPACDRRFKFGILTAPLSCASCLLLLVSCDYHSFRVIICWKPGTVGWSELVLKEAIMTMGVFKDRILVMDSKYHLKEVEFFPRPSWKYVEVTIPFVGRDIMYEILCDHYLVECGEVLLLVRIAHKGRIEVYRLDWPGSVWVKMTGLGDWCLFIDVGRKFAMACHGPRRWGGRANCIYFAPRWSGSWLVVPLSGGVMDTGRVFPFSASLNSRFLWPSSVWVYPSTPL